MWTVLININRVKTFCIISSLLKFDRVLDLSVKELDIQTFSAIRRILSGRATTLKCFSVKFKCNPQKRCFKKSCDRRDSSLGKYHSVGSIHESLSEITRNKSWKTGSFLNVLFFFLSEFTFNLCISSPEVELFSINTTCTKLTFTPHLFIIFWFFKWIMQQEWERET